MTQTLPKLPLLTPRLTWIMAIASGVSIANIYYIQPFFSTVAGKLSDKKGPRFTVCINIAVIALSFVVFWLWGLSLIA